MMRLPERELKEGACPGSGRPSVTDSVYTYENAVTWSGPGDAPVPVVRHGGVCPVCGRKYGLTRVEGVLVRHGVRSGKTDTILRV